MHFVILLTAIAVAALQASAADQPKAALFRVVDRADSQTIPCRIHLKDSAGEPVRAGPLPFFNDHFVCPGTAEVSLTPGRYSVEIERGPEYSRVQEQIVIDGEAPKQLRYELSRVANLAREGWWSGELHVHRPVEQVELLMRAEDLHVAPVITWHNDQNIWSKRAKPAEVTTRFDTDRFYHVMGGEDEREGGALLFLNLEAPLAITGSTREYPSPMRFLAEARSKPGAWVDIEKPFWWDLPIWLASGQCDSIGIANNHMCRSGMLPNEAWGKPRDAARLPEPRGNGFWTQEIYYHILNAGLRLPPSAGSASGVLPNPVGYNRIYVHLGDTLDYKSWWEGIKAGRSFVSNGPLLRCRANGQWPGHVFSCGEGETLKIDVEASLTSLDPVSEIEIIRNGAIERTVPASSFEKNLKLGPIEFRESGWFLVRVVANEPKTFRFASTAPFYVEVGAGKHRISKRSAQFFLDWAHERKNRVKLADDSQLAEVLAHHDTAERFWTERVSRANAE